MKKLALIGIFLLVLTGCSDILGEVSEATTYTVSESEISYPAKIVSEKQYSYQLLDASATTLSNNTHVASGDVLFTTYYEETENQVSSLNSDLNYAYQDLDTTNQAIANKQADLDQKRTLLKSEKDPMTKQELSSSISMLEQEISGLKTNKTTLERSVETYNRNLGSLKTKDETVAPFAGTVLVEQNAMTLYSDSVLLKLSATSASINDIKDGNLTLKTAEGNYKLEFTYYEVDPTTTSPTSTGYNVYYKIVDFKEPTVQMQQAEVFYKEDAIYIPMSYVFEDENGKTYVNIDNKQVPVTGTVDNTRLLVESGVEVGDQLLDKEVDPGDSND